MITKEFEEEKVINEDVKGKRKINVRFEYLTKMKLYYRKFMAKHYAKKEQKMLGDKSLYASEADYNVAHQNVIDKMNQHVEKFEEHKERLAEIEEIKKERALEKTNDKYSKAMEELAENVTQKNADETIQAEEQLSQVQQAQMPVLENSEKTMDSIQQTSSQDVQEIQNNTPVVAEEVASIEPVEMPQDVVETVAQSVSEEVAAAEPVEMPQDVVKTVAQSVSEVLEENNSVKELLDQFGQSKTEFDSDWERAMQAVKNAVKNYNSQIQKSSVEALANKQIELHEQKKENNRLSQQNKDLMNAKNQLNSDLLNSQNEVASLKKSNQEKDAQIQNLTSENQTKDKKINDITSLYNDQLAQNKLYEEENAKLRRDVEAMSQQFKQMQEMFNGFQSRMGSAVQQSTSAVVEEPAQKVK